MSQTDLADALRDVAFTTTTPFTDDGESVVYDAVRGNVEFLLPPAYDRQTVTVSLHQNSQLAFWDFLEDIEPIFRTYDGRPHWAKNTHSAPRNSGTAIPSGTAFGDSPRDGPRWRVHERVSHRTAGGRHRRLMVEHRNTARQSARRTGRFRVVTCPSTAPVPNPRW